MSNESIRVNELINKTIYDLNCKSNTLLSDYFEFKKKIAFEKAEKEIMVLNIAEEVEKSRIAAEKADQMKKEVFLMKITQAGK